MSAGNGLRVVFMGTPDFAVPALHALIDHGFEVVAVYSQPPRPKGRGQQVQLSPVHAAAEEAGIPVFTPKSLRRDNAAQVEFAAHNADVAVVAAYGLLLPPAVLEAPRLGCLNIHASLLPRWRGAAPIQYAIWKGDERSGVGIMQMEEGLDTGPVLAQRAVPIRPETTARSLHDELSALGAALVVEVLQKLAAGEKLVPTPQDDRAATYAPMLDKVDGIVDWTQTATEIGRQVRALNPWPGVWTIRLSGRRIKIIDAEPVSEQFPAAPGTVVDRHGHVACGGDTGLKLHVVQPENARPMDATAAINGLYLRVDDVLG